MFWVAVFIALVSGLVFASHYVISKVLIDSHTFTCPGDARYCQMKVKGSILPGKSRTYDFYAVYKIPVTTTTTTTTTSTTSSTTTTTLFECDPEAMFCCWTDSDRIDPETGEPFIEPVPC